MEFGITGMAVMGSGKPPLKSREAGIIKKPTSRRLVERIRSIPDISPVMVDPHSDIPKTVSIPTPQVDGSDPFEGSNPVKSPVPRYLQTHLQSETRMQPTKMKRANQWDFEVENLFRFQEAGYRDALEYCSAHSPPEIWEESGFVRMLINKKNGCFLYFRRNRECQPKDLNRIKIYYYD